MSDTDAKDRLSFAIFWAMWQRGITPPRLATAIGKSPDAVRRWRDGESAPSALDVGRLAQALGVRPDYLTNPPEIPSYPFEDFTTEPGDAQSIVAATVAEGQAQGEERARQPRGGEVPSMPRQSRARRSRASGR